MAASKDLIGTIVQIYQATESFMAVNVGDYLVELPDGKLYVIKNTVTSITRLTKRMLGPGLNKQTYLPSLRRVENNQKKTI